MRPRPGLLRPLPLSLVAAGFIASIAAAAPGRSVRPDVTLWVVQPPGEVVAFDLADFSRVGGVRIPPVAFNEPGRLSINGLGQMLVQLDADHLWLWDGDAARTLPIAPDLRGTDSTPSSPSTPVPQWLLGDDSKSLYVLQSNSRQGTSAADSASSSHFVARATSLAQQPRDPIFSILRKPCQKQYGFPANGTEPCPDPEIWAPGGVVRTYFVLTHWEQDSLADPAWPQASLHRTLYRRSVKGWRASDLGTWDQESLIDVSADGAAWVQTVEDGGCCGESNGGSDQAVFGSADTALILFDEWSSFHNQSYDMSFFTTKARIAPGGNRVAFTVHATEAPGAAIPVSAEGHPDTLVLASIQRSLADLPIVEIRATRPQAMLFLRLPRAELIGWASDSEVLIVERGHIIGVDVITKRRRKSGIGVRTAEDASVVWK